jgi:hypothetical protein
MRAKTNCFAVSVQNDSFHSGIHRRRFQKKPSFSRQAARHRLKTILN